jgi:hypothetical protein
VVFYEMLTGELPLGRFPLPSKKVHIDVRLDEVVLKTLEKEPELRYQQASEVKVDVETICSDRKAETNASWSPKAGDDIESIRHRVWIPAVGLLFVGLINCLSVIGALWGAVVPGSKGPLLVTLMVAHTLIVIFGAWNLMQLRSYRLAVAGSILGIITPAFFLGLPMGIWALVLLTKKEVKAAFGQKKTEVVIPPKIREFTVSAVKDAKVAYGRGKAEVQKIIRETSTDSQELDTAARSKTLGMGIASFALGLVSILLLSLNTGFAAKFAYGFLSIFFAVFLGVMAIKNIKSYREHLVDTGFAIAGILFALISAIRLLVTASP